MSLKDQALEAYERETRERKTADKESTLTLALFATQKFQSQFQVEDPLTFQPVSETHALLKIAETIQIEARAEYEAIEFYAIVPCQKCEDMGYKRIATSADLGEAIKCGPPCSCTEPPLGSATVMPEGPDAHLADIASALNGILTVLQKVTTRGGSFTVSQ